MVSSLWLKVSAGITVLCGMYTTYKVSRYIRLKRMPILSLSSLPSDSKDFMTQGKVSLPPNTPYPKIEKYTNYSLSGDVVSKQYIKSTFPITIKEGNASVTVNLQEVIKIRCQPPETRHEVLVHTLTESFTFFLDQILSIFTDSKSRIPRSRKIKITQIANETNAVILGKMSDKNKGYLIAETVSSSKEAILDYYFKGLRGPAILFAIAGSLTMIIGFVYLSKPVLKEAADEEIEQGLECSVCLVRKKNILLWPCKHVCLCDRCYNGEITKCPLCRTKVEYQYKIEY